MIPLLKSTVVACALLAPMVTTAQLTLGVRAGAAFPLGDLEEGRPVDERLARAFPLEASVGWRLSPGVEVGLQGGYGIGSKADGWTSDCSATAGDCRVHLWTVAARGEVATKMGDLLPFAAATLGWEWEVERWETSADNWERTSRSGWLAGLEAGADLPITEGLHLGGFVGASVGQFGALSVTGETAGYGYEDAGQVPGPALHGWLSIGLRGKFNL